LKKENSKVKALRDGKYEEINCSDLCVGDIFELEADINVPVDAVMVYGEVKMDVKTIESNLKRVFTI
jgi:magnesium-transporting ATPase (P-type)